MTWRYKGVMILVAGLVPASTSLTSAAPGDVVAVVTLPQSGVFGTSIAADCAGNLYYTVGDEFLYRTDKLGTAFAPVPLTDENGLSVKVDEMSWDDSRSRLWGVERTHILPTFRVFLINPATGAAVRQFGYTNNHPTVDGLAYDPYNDELWIKGDGDPRIDHFTPGGVPLSPITITQGGFPIAVSGVCVASGNILYVGRPNLGRIGRAQKSNGDYIGDFAVPGGHNEGLECDPVSFQPMVVLWSRDAYNNTVTAFELAPDACSCGATPVEDRTWGAIKVQYR